MLADSTLKLGLGTIPSCRSTLPITRHCRPTLLAHQILRRPTRNHDAVELPSRALTTS
jgi:hypothetical protein